MRSSLNPRWARRRALVVASAVLSAAANIQAQTWTAGGGLGNNAWSVNANWSSAPANNGTANIVFGSSGNGTSVVDTSWSVNSLTINVTSPSWVLSNSNAAQLTVGAGGITGQIILGLPVILGANQTWNSGSSFISNHSAETVNLNGHVLKTIEASGETISLLNVSGSGGITQSAAGILQLFGTNTFTGFLNISNGSTIAAYSLGATSSPISINTGTLQLYSSLDPSTHPLTVTGGGNDIDCEGQNITLSGNIGGTGALALSDGSGGGSFTLQGSNSFSSLALTTTVFVNSESNMGAGGGNLLDSGTLVIGSSFLSSRPMYFYANSQLNVSNGATLTYSGNATNYAAFTKTGPGTLVLSSAAFQTLGTAGSVFNLAGGIVNVTTAANLGPNTEPLLLNGGTLQFATAFDPTANGGTRNVSIGANGGSIDTNGLTVTINNPMNAVGNGTFTKAGAGTLIFAGVQNYSGNTNVSAGTLQTNVASALNAVYNLNIVAGATFNQNNHPQTVLSLTGGGNYNLGSANLTLDGNYFTNSSFSGSISGTGGLLINGGETQQLLGTSTYTGTTNVSNGMVGINSSASLGQTGAPLLLGNGLSFYSGGVQFEAVCDPSVAHPITLGSGGGGYVDTAGLNITFAGALNGTGSFSVQDSVGGGSLTLTQPSNQGVTNVDASGILNISVPGSLGPSGSQIYLQNGTLRLTSSIILNQSITSQSPGGGTIDVTPGNTVTLTGPINTNTVLTVTDTGTLVLDNSSTTGGNINVTGGATVATASNNQLSTGQITLNNGTFRTLSGAVDPTANASLYVGPGLGSIDTDGFTVTFSRVISGSGAFLKTGSGTLILASYELYNGATGVNGGTLQAGVANIDASSQLYVGSPGTFNLNGHNQQFTALVGDGIIALGGAVLSIGSSGLSGTFSGSITGSGSVVINNNGNTALTGSSSFTGTTNISNGGLTVGQNSSLGANGSGVLLGQTSSNSFLIFGGTFDPSTTHPITIGSFGGTIDTDAHNITFASSIGGTGPLSIMDSIGQLNPLAGGSLTLQSSGTQSSTNLLYGGKLFISADNSLGSLSAPLNFSGGTLGTTSTFSLGQTSNVSSAGGTIDVAPGTSISIGLIGGSGMLIKSDSGTLTLNFNNTLTGGFNITGGTLTATTNTELGPASNRLILDGGTLNLATVYDPTTSSTTARTVQMGPNGGTFLLGLYSANIANPISGPGGLTLTSTGASNLVLKSQETYGGFTNISTGAIVTAVVNAIPSTSAVNVGGFGSLLLDNLNQSIGSLSGAGNVYLGTANLTTGNDNTNTSYSGNLGNTNSSTGGGIVKVGTGVFTLSGSNSYTGATNISGGTLAASSNNNLGASGTPLIFNQSGGSIPTLGFAGVFDPTNSHSVFINTGVGAFDVMGRNITINGTISGNTWFEAADSVGGGVLTLNGSNAFGDLYVGPNATASVNSDTAMGTANSYVTFAGNSTLITTASFSTPRQFTIGQAAGQSNTLNVSTGTLTLTGSVLLNQTLIKAGPGTLALGGIVTPNGTNSILNVSTGTVSMAITANISSPVLVCSGATFNIQAPTAGSSTVGYPILYTLNISSGGVAAILPVSRVSSNSNGDLVSLNSLIIASAGSFDLSNNQVILHNMSIGSTTMLTAIGCNSGNWNGNGGIMDSNASSDTTHLHAIGTVLNNFPSNPLIPVTTQLYTTFEGETALSTDVLVKYTYYGDANLDGKLDGSDYSRIDSAFGYNRLPVTTKTSLYPDYPQYFTGWFNGDFNYDGMVDGSDYTLMDNAFNMQGTQIATELAAPTALVGSSSAVPEPIGLPLAWGATLALARRRRHRKG